MRAVSESVGWPSAVVSPVDEAGWWLLFLINRKGRHEVSGEKVPKMHKCELPNPRSRAWSGTVCKGGRGGGGGTYALELHVIPVLLLLVLLLLQGGNLRIELLRARALPSLPPTSALGGGIPCVV